ncbi:MAG TPA: tetratricopeptide repeat protein, partial [Polyangiaceae bacterium]
MFSADSSGSGSTPARREPLLGRAWRSVASYFSEQRPSFWVAIAPALVVAALVYTRSPASNFIFDEQEALLANPYVNGHELGFLDAFRRDFWGLPPERTIGSYRPLPNLVWWVFWRISELPWLPHWVNIVVHAANAALVASFVLALSRERALSWFAGAAFLLSAVITEAVTGVVGLADVLGGLGVLLALHALRLPMAVMPFGVLGAVLLGLFSKESVLVAVPLVGWAALVTAPHLHPARPWCAGRATAAWLFAGLALVGYTYFRRHFFPIELPDALAEPLPDGTPLHQRAMHDFMRWFQQPRLPRDPINNPLVAADVPHRVAGALRVYWHGLGQVLLPFTLSGDYSYAAEPVPARVVS